MSEHARLQIGKIIRDAVVFNFGNWPNQMLNSDSLLQSVKDLFALLSARKIDYLLVGGVALLAYIEGRNTEDIDLIMAFSSLEKLPEIQIIGQDVYFARGQFGDLKIDILLTKNPLFSIVKQKYVTTQHFLEQDIPTATVEGLLLLKLYALPSLYRQGNFTRVSIYENDIATLLHDYQPAIEPLYKELSRYLGEPDMNSVKEIIGDIQHRIDRFRKTKKD